MPNRACELCQPLGDAWSKHHVCDLPDSVVLLSKDQFFRGWTLVVSRRHVDDLFDLPAEERRLLEADVERVAAALRSIVCPDRMNYAIFGNVTPHLHWNLIPRFIDDGLWGGPPWPHEPRRASPEELAALQSALRGELLRR